MDIKFDFDDILIVPEVTTNINSRSEVSVRDHMDKLPLFAAPMDTVVNKSNVNAFLDNGIRVCLPRQAELDQTHISTDENVFYSYSLADFRAIFLSEYTIIDERIYALIDVANGHMPAVYDAIVESKAIYGERLQLMVGNVANPETYAYLSDAGANYIRLGIGGGNMCLTSEQTGVGYPLASLINECYIKSLNLVKSAKIVADGGFKKYSDIIKALALGADFVMLGTIFNKAIESAGDEFVKSPMNSIYLTFDEWVESFQRDFIYGFNAPLPTKYDLMNQGLLYKKCRGMSTKEVQKGWGNAILKTSEGIVKYQKVEYTLSGWVENFEHYLKSAMSYTNSNDLNSFIGQVQYINITENAFKRYNK